MFLGEKDPSLQWDSETIKKISNNIKIVLLISTCTDCPENNISVSSYPAFW